MSDRRQWLQHLAALAVAARMATSAAPVRAADGLPTIPLWPDVPPDGPGPDGAEKISDKGSVTHVARPYLRVYRPARPNGVAMLVMAGGGYAHIECGKESTPAARWLQAQGVTAFELVYRLPSEGWAQPLVPLQDGQRAMRLVRSRAAAFGLDATRIGVMGFSAGAHLAGMTAVAPDVVRYAPVDAADAVSARPDFAALLYPVLTMLPPFDHTHARRELLGAHPTAAQSQALSVEQQVVPGAPPTFLAQALDDPVSPIDNSLRMFAALRQAQVPTALHVFTSGRHGWGMGPAGTEVAAWPNLFTAWAVGQGWFLR